MSECDRCGLKMFCICHGYPKDTAKKVKELEERISKLEEAFKAQALTELTKISEEMGLYEHL